MQSGPGPGPYTYTDLPARRFRLLTLHPGKPGTEIRISLHRYLLPFSEKSDTPYYDAISYTWNNQPRSQEIRCDEQRLYITQNLYNALTCFRDRKKTNLLWADAICINQDSNAEKNDQISWMRLIFGRAGRVLCWLGLEGVMDRQLFDAVSMYDAEKLDSDYYIGAQGDRTLLLTASDKKKEDLGRWYARTLGKRRLLDRIGRNHMFACSYGDILRALSELCDDDYFRRAWVFQETALSSRVHICRGAQQQPWILFVRAMASVSVNDLIANELPLGFGQSLTEMSLLNIEWGQRQELNDFFSVITNCCSSQCSDQRDYVYAFLGLCGVDSGLNFSVDYGRTVGETYHQATFEALESHRGNPTVCYGSAKYLFLLCGMTKLHAEENMPSWVPDYSRISSLEDWIDVYRTVYYASLQQTMVCMIPEDDGPDTETLNHVAARPDNIVLSGDIVDCVAAKTVSHTSKVLDEEGFVWKVFLQDLRDRHRFLADYGRHKNAEKGFRWRTLCGDFFVNDGTPLQAPTGFGSKFQRLVERLYRTEYQDTDLLDSSYLAWDDETAGFLESCIRWYYRRGEIGMSRDGRGINLPPGAEVCDHIFIAAGSNMPLVIRRTDGGRYKLIGWCYLDGAMYGELWPKDRVGKEIAVGKPITLA